MTRQPVQSNINNKVQYTHYPPTRPPTIHHRGVSTGNSSLIQTVYYFTHYQILNKMNLYSGLECLMFNTSLVQSP